MTSRWIINRKADMEKRAVMEFNYSEEMNEFRTVLENAESTWKFD